MINSKGAVCRISDADFTDGRVRKVFFAVVVFFLKFDCLSLLTQQFRYFCNYYYLLVKYILLCLNGPAFARIKQFTCNFFNSLLTETSF